MVLSQGPRSLTWGYHRSHLVAAELTWTPSKWDLGLLSDTWGFHVSNGWSPDKEGSHYFILSANHLTTKEKSALDAGWNRRVWTRQLLVGSMRESSAAASDLWGNGCASDSPHCRSWALEGAMNEDLQTPRWAGPDCDPCSKWSNDAEKSRGLLNTSHNNQLQNWIRI